MLHKYLCIDLKSFYASVECVDRNFDPLTTDLIVADPERGKGTICLAVSSHLKKQGVRNRCRLFEVPKNLSYIQAKPRMKRYLEFSARVVACYLKYVDPDDIYIYSVDECFIDATPYLSLYHLDLQSFAALLMNDVLERVGIPSTCGMGQNVFLAKLALDILAKHSPNGLAYLDAELFKEKIWNHRPISDIWRIGPGIQRRLFNHGIFDLEGIVKADPKVLYDEFGVDAELLIDHAWGIEYCSLQEIKDFHPRKTSISQGQILICEYENDAALIALLEMADELILDLRCRGLSASGASISLSLGRESARVASNSLSMKFEKPTSSRKKILDYFRELHARLFSIPLQVRKVNIALTDLVEERSVPFSIFEDISEYVKNASLTITELDIREKYGKAVLLYGRSLREFATGRERAQQIGGHNA